MDFNANYFEKEIRCGFEIPTMMKRAWAAEIEVLSVIDDICKRNDITWFAEFGTLLGAIRHGGFIPWDDDIDICLKREEYMKLIRLLPQELPKGFVVAGMYADSERLQKAANVNQLRVIADETLWDYNEYVKYFHGFPYLRIGIDIFPLDYLSTDEETEALQNEILKYGFVTLHNWEYFKNNGELNDRIKYIEKLCNVNIIFDGKEINYLWKLMDKLSSLWNEEECEDIVEYIFYLDDKNYRMKKEWYDSVEYVDFEGMIKMPVPNGYRQILKHLYGDYEKPMRIYDDHNYPFYGNMTQELERQVKNSGFKGSVDEFCDAVLTGRFRV